ncbi:hypothetical protein GOODEAATRI_019550 [Goodea atripinnis]|uniref:Uncharacterized protein n=1 Tax=Goodea atripinnis TaxID=208336 RepID=A0ABV0PZC9_9TELE
MGGSASLQVELTGSSVFDYIHPADHVEMAERLGIKPHLRAEAGCHTAPDSASSTASTSSLAGTPEPGTFCPGTYSACQVIHVTGRIRCRPALVPGSTRVYGSDPCRGGGTYLLSFCPCGRPGKYPAEPRGP